MQSSHGNQSRGLKWGLHFSNFWWKHRFPKSWLEFTGVGYKAAVNGNVLNLSLGYSHPIDYTLPVGITAKVNKNQIDIEGSNKELVGQVAAKVRSFREPEPYKGKGVKYTTEKIIRKAGKAGGKGK